MVLWSATNRGREGGVVFTLANTPSKMSMERLYQETSSLLQEAHFSMGRLERATSKREADDIVQHIREQLRIIDQNWDQLGILVNKESATRRHIVRLKVDQLKTDSQNIHYAITSIYTNLTAKWKAASDREELLHQRFRTNESTRLSMDDHELQMNDRLNSSNRHVDDLISQGVAVLENLRSQHMNLRGIRRKILDIGGALGLSNTTLRMIDRRIGEDWLIFVVGCIVTLIFMYAFYRFWKG
ncbi:hypothetical protein KIN20_020829 [Parelaphostrongylus tenuis]|uniref:Golgi SNAP receptor complex member 2 n=1 Tax=Parelaphostrongylus tenuis TaxID=148309 RepID=A0AAD5N4J7_PARTN|nr:hypothetical protein KIN20_020829 [Parelaphostrongylus tenuis]